jgi:hypothetical protein
LRVRPLAAAGALLAMIALGGCLGDDERRGSALEGGTASVALGDAPVVLDPALVPPAGNDPLWLVYTPPLTYRRAEGREGTELVPGVARALPEVSGDGTIYSLRVRRGLRFSNGRPVTARDVRHTILRAAALGPAGRRLFAGVTRIEADDRSGAVRIHLRRPDPSFPHALAAPPAGGGAPAPARRAGGRAGGAPGAGRGGPGGAGRRGAGRAPPRPLEREVLPGPGDGDEVDRGPVWQGQLGLEPASEQLGVDPSQDVLAVGDLGPAQPVQLEVGDVEPGRPVGVDPERAATLVVDVDRVVDPRPAGRDPVEPGRVVVHGGRQVPDRDDVGTGHLPQGREQLCMAPHPFADPLGADIGLHPEERRPVDPLDGTDNRLLHLAAPEHLLRLPRVADRGVAIHLAGTARLVHDRADVVDLPVEDQRHQARVPVRHARPRTYRGVRQPT